MSESSIGKNDELPPEANKKETQTNESVEELLSKQGGIRPENQVSKNTEYLSVLALELFDGTRSLHALGADSRRVLEMAALLYELPYPQTNKKPHRAALALVKSYAPEDLSGEQKKVLAAVIGFQRRKLKKKDFSRLKLSPMQEREVLTISAILRIAIGLDDSDSQGTVIQKIEADRHEMWVIVDGPKAASDAAVGRHNSRLWAKIGYPEVKILVSAEAADKLVPFPDPMKTPGIEAADPLAEAGRKVMRYHFAKMLKYEEGTRLGEDIEALHDMRVASRRLRAAFEVFGRAFESGALKPHLKGLRKTGRALGSVRDLDVFMEKAQIYLDKLPEDQQVGMDLLLEDWEKKREKARVTMITYLDSQEYYEFKRKFNVFLHTPGAGVRKAPKDQPVPHQVNELAPVLIYTRMGVVRSYDAFIEGASIERLHALRIDFKKLRYTVEYFREVLGVGADDVIDDLKRLQDHLGDLNDAQVATQILKEFIGAFEHAQAAVPSDDPQDLKTAKEREDLKTVESYLTFRQVEGQRLMTTFGDAWTYFNRPEFRHNLALAIAAL